jgi:uncharacterized membrane protein YhaH (DUF805 family)
MIQKYYFKVIKNKYADFSGRATRTEYWYYTLFNCLFFLVMGFIGSMIDMILNGQGQGFVTPLIQVSMSFGLMLPSCAVFIRRLHDTGRSGWWSLAGLIPILGGIVLLVLVCLPSQTGPNRFGPDPALAMEISDVE